MGVYGISMNNKSESTYENALVTDGKLEMYLTSRVLYLEIMDLQFQVNYRQVWEYQWLLW